jgi:hypothetical protein
MFADADAARDDALPTTPTTPTAAVTTRVVRVPPLSRVQLATMLGTGFLFQACASGRLSFAAAAWLCLLPLAVLVRAASLPVALVGAFGAVFFGRLVGWAGVVDDGVVGAALAALLMVFALLAYRHVMRELPRAGSFALPLAVVTIEGVAAATHLPGLSLLPLSTSQASDVPLWRFVDVLTPAGVSFCVAWAQGAMAGFGESWIAEDPHDQQARERGVQLGAASSFWLVGVVVHVGGFLRAPAQTVGAGTTAATTAASGDLSLVLTGVAASVLVVFLIAATVVRVRRKTPPASLPAAREVLADSSR